MVEIDSFTDTVKLSKSELGQAENYTLITKARNDKLELCLHLLANLSQILVVYGPKGIGKTTLLKLLIDRLDSSECRLVTAAEELTLEQVIAILDDPNSPGQASQHLSRFKNKSNKTVLIIDDAGKLIPGLITAIIDYVATQAGLSVIFSLTPDDLYLKNHSDGVINDCYFIEIPPLSEPQCGNFLQYLSTKTASFKQGKEISDTLIALTYHQSHGVPGNIASSFVVPKATQKKDYALWLLIAAVVVLVAVALGVQWYSAAKML